MKNGLKVLMFVFVLSFLVFSNNVSALQFTLGMSPSGPFSVQAGQTQYYTIQTKNTGGLFDGDMNCTLIEYYGAFQNDRTTFTVTKGSTQTTGIYVNTPQGQTGTINTNYVVTCQDWIGTNSQSISTAVAYTAPNIQFTITPSKNTVGPLFNGQTETVTITVSNQMSQSISCDKNLGSISAGGSNAYSITVQAPATGSGTTTQTETATCSYSGVSSSKSATITVNYQSDPCVAALANAQNSITDANSQITNAKNKIQEASNLGADTTNAQALLNQASSQYSSAQTSLSTAQTTCNSGDKINGPNQANSALSYAMQAKSYATDALNSAQNSITELNRKKTDAANEISNANSKVTTANIMIDKANAILTNATSLSSALPELTKGWDLITPKSDINTAKAKLDQSKNYIQEANAALTNKSFDLAFDKATSAFQYSEDANSLATSAFNSLNEKVLGLGEVANALMSATSEVTQTDDMLNKMTYIERSVEKYGVSLSDAKTITSDSQTSIDSAKDLLSQAKDRYQAGMSSDAIQKAIAARDAAAEPTNRLERIVSSMKISTLDALEKAQTDMEAKVSSAESAVSDAAKSYGATSSEVIAAQQDLADAKAQLSNATDRIKNVESASDLSTLVQNAGTSFQALEGIQAQVTSANNHANSAKMGLITTVGSVGAAGAAAAGGGFLYWRRRKNKNPTSQNKTEHKKHEDGEKIKDMEKPKHEEQKDKFCHKCGSKLEKHHKFCPKCGNKVK